MAWDGESGDAGGRTGSGNGGDLDMAARVEEARLREGAVRARDLAEAELQKAPGDHPARVALAMALMDLGDPQAARDQLAQYLESLLTARPPAGDPAPSTPAEADGAELPPSPLTRELSASWAGEGAAAGSDPVPVSTSSPEVPERGRRPSKGSGRGEFPFGTTSSFATQTMAGLRDRQGDQRRADVIRESLDRGAPAQEEPEEAPVQALKAEDEEEQRIVQTLNVWLRNIERERA